MFGSRARWVVVIVAAGTPALSLAGCRACCEPVRCPPVRCAPASEPPRDPAGPVASAASPGSAPYAAAPAGPAAAPRPSSVETLKALRLTLTMKEASLTRVLQAVAEQGKFNLFLSPDVADVPVSIDVQDQDVPTVLTALGKDRFVWSVEDYGIVRIQGLPPK